MAESIQKTITLDKENIEFIQNLYGPSSMSFIVNTLLSSLKEVMREKSISFPSLYKQAAIEADEIIRETS